MPQVSLSSQPTQIAKFDTPTEVLIRVKGNGVMLLSQNLSDSQNGVGIEYTSLDGVQRVRWQGELWSVATTIDPAGIYQFVFNGQDVTYSNDNLQTPATPPLSLLDRIVAQFKPHRPSKPVTDTTLSDLTGGAFKLVLFLVLFCGLAYSQVPTIVIPPSSSPMITIGRGLKWGTTGKGGISNFFLITPLPQYQTACLYVANNNPTNNHTFNIDVFATGDTQNQTWTGGQGWSDIMPATLPVSQIVGSAPSSPLIFPITMSSVAHILILFSQSSTLAGNPDTADVFLVQGITSCGAKASNGLFLGSVFSGSTGNNANLISPVACDQSARISILAGTTKELVPGIAGTRIHVCAYQATIDTAPAGASLDQFVVANTGGTCGSPSILWDVEFTATVSTHSMGSGTGQLFQTEQFTFGRSLCYANLSANPENVDVSFAQY